MLVVACPQCGAPARVALEQRETLDCTHCDYVGAMPEVARDRLAAAAREVSATDASARQLHGLSRRLATNASSVSVQYALIVTVLASIAGYLTHCLGTEWSRGGGRELILPAVSAALLLILALPFGVAIVRSTRAIADTCTATPAFAQGQPFGCWICGAPVASTPPIARCSHCGADNLVDPKLIARAAMRRGRDIAELQHEVSDQLTALHDRSVSGVSFISSFGALFLPALVILFGERILLSLDTDFGADEAWFVAVLAEEPGVWKIRERHGCFFQRREDAAARAALRVEKVHPSWARELGTYVTRRPLFGAIVMREETAADNVSTMRQLEPLDGFCRRWAKRLPSQE